MAKVLQSTNHVALKSISIPTSNRVEALRRCLLSYAAGLEKQSRDTAIVVADDSKRPEINQGYKELLRSIGSRYGLAVLYAGIPEKLAFVNRLLKTTGAPADVLKFGLFDSGKTGLPTYGANRNALLLQNAGEAFLSVDDDTVYQPGTLGRIEAGYRDVCEERFSESYPCEVIITGSRDQALGTLTYGEMDVLAHHESVLGRSLSDQHCPQSEPGKLPAGGVKISFNGVAGDCGWPSSFIQLLFTGSSLDRLVESNEIYTTARGSRYGVRAVTKACLGQVMNAPGMFAAFDNREFLPPFFPVGRGEDVIYWNTVVKCCGPKSFAFIPPVLLHLPIEHRSYSAEERKQVRVGFDLFMLLLALVRSGPQVNPETLPAQRFQQLARHLIQIGQLTPREFRDLVRWEIGNEAQALADHLAAQTESRPRASEEWKGDVAQAVKAIRHYAKNPEPLVPADLSSHQEFEAAALVQRLIFLFGQLLQYWPAIMTETQLLRSNGQSIAHRL